MAPPIKLQQAEKGIKTAKLNKFVLHLQEKIKTHSIVNYMNKQRLKNNIRRRGGFEEVVRNAADEFQSTVAPRQARNRITSESPPRPGKSRASVSRESRHSSTLSRRKERSVAVNKNLQWAHRSRHVQKAPSKSGAALEAL